LERLDSGFRRNDAIDFHTKGGRLKLTALGPTSGSRTGTAWMSIPHQYLCFLV
jgi:hypothetical protein